MINIFRFFLWNVIGAAPLWRFILWFEKKSLFSQKAAIIICPWQSTEWEEHAGCCHVFASSSFNMKKLLCRGAPLYKKVYLCTVPTTTAQTLLRGKRREKWRERFKIMLFLAVISLFASSQPQQINFWFLSSCCSFILLFTLSAWKCWIPLLSAKNAGLKNGLP